MLYSVLVVPNKHSPVTRSLAYYPRLVLINPEFPSKGGSRVPPLDLSGGGGYRDTGDTQDTPWIPQAPTTPVTKVNQVYQTKINALNRGKIKHFKVITASGWMI